MFKVPSTKLINIFKSRFDIVNINLKSKPSWFLERSPLGKVPALERAKGDVVSESLITMDYLEESYPTPQILSDDPWKKAQDKMLTELFGVKVSS